MGTEKIYAVWVTGSPAQTRFASILAEKLLEIADKITLRQHDERILTTIEVAAPHAREIGTLLDEAGIVHAWSQRRALID